MQAERDMNLSQKGFKVVHLNTRSIRNKTVEIHTLVQYYDIDVFTCSESWLHAGIENACMTIPNYNLFRLDRSWLNHHNTIKKGGGLMSYIKNIYTVNDRIYAHLNKNAQHIEAQVLSLKKSNNKGTIIINVYRPHGGCQSQFVDDINSILSNLQNIRYIDVIDVIDLTGWAPCPLL